MRLIGGDCPLVKPTVQGVERSQDKECCMGLKIVLLGAALMLGAAPAPVPP
ncbi:hypothetical protein [Aeromonas rivipollensis]|uniref:hypothetical protein n=1 Tax=Aeromonas rivipollensis TaxID=948519 RepID=UPI00372D76C8